jgi:hypothetical protein
VPVCGIDKEERRKKTEAGWQAASGTTFTTEEF